MRCDGAVLEGCANGESKVLAGGRSAERAERPDGVAPPGHPVDETLLRETVQGIGGGGDRGAGGPTASWKEKSVRPSATSVFTRSSCRVIGRLQNQYSCNSRKA